jgi:hypothetical protein
MNNSRRVQVATTKTKYESLRDERVNVFNMVRQLSPQGTGLGAVPDVKSG